MRNLTRFLANLANQDLYDYQVRFVENLKGEMKMAKVNDEILVKCNGTSQVDISPVSLTFYHTLDGMSRAIGVPDIKRVIFSDLYTIVIWNDGTKTIVRCTDEKFDKEKGLAMCIAKKSLGNKGKYYDVFKKWIEEDEK